MTAVEVELTPIEEGIVRDLTQALPPGCAVTVTDAYPQPFTDVWVRDAAGGHVARVAWCDEDYYGAVNADRVPKQGAGYYVVTHGSRCHFVGGTAEAVRDLFFGR